MSRTHASVKYQRRLRERAEQMRQNLGRVFLRKPKPTELPPPADFIDLVVYPTRWLDCPGYDDCLDVAATGNWASFSCERCPVHRLYLEVKKLAEELEAAPGIEPGMNGFADRRLTVLAMRP